MLAYLFPYIEMSLCLPQDHKSQNKKKAIRRSETLSTHHYLASV